MATQKPRREQESPDEHCTSHRDWCHETRYKAETQSWEAPSLNEMYRPPITTNYEAVMKVKKAPVLSSEATRSSDTVFSCATMNFGAEAE